MVVRASDPEAAKRPRGWTLHSLPADEIGPVLPETPQVGPAAQAEAMSDLCGRLLGARYDVRELRSHGEKGAVYLGFDRNYGRVVDLKISAPQAVDAGEDVRGRARRRMGVRHVHLAALQGEGLTEGGLHYVAMEHVEGRNLHHMLGDPRLAWPAVHAIGVQVAEALVALHGAWVVHGAVHPGNLVWAEEGEKAVNIKLVDLDVSGAATAYGPPGFAGVEADTSGDVFALAVTLYELSTGGLPDAGLTTLARAEVPEWFAALLRSVLQGGLTIPGARALLASLRQGGGQDALAAPVAVPRALSAPVVVPREASSPVVMVPRALSSPLTIALPPVPVVPAPSGPVPVAASPSGPAPVAASTTGPVPTVSATEDELWFAAVEAFDPLERIEAMAAEAGEPEVDLEVEVVKLEESAVASASEVAVSVEPEAPAVDESGRQGRIHFVGVGPAGDDAREAGVEPPPSFGGAGESLEEAPAMVTMQAAFDPRPTPVLESGSVPAPGATFSEEPGVRVAPAPSRGGRVLMAVAAALVLVVVLWRLGAGGGDVTPAPVAAPVPVPVKSVEPAKPPVAPPPAGSSSSPRPAVPADSAAAVPAGTTVTPDPPAATPADAPPAEPPAVPTAPVSDVADDEPADEPPVPGVAREQLSAGEFRGVLLRSNRGPAATHCYMMHTAGVEQKVEAVVRVGAGGRVQKVRIEEGPLGDCLRRVIEKLVFPRAQRSAQHQYVFRSPIE